MSNRIAGHIFDHAGRCTVLNSNGEPCAVRWLDIQHVTMDDISKTGYAHHLGLNSNECQEIMIEKARRDMLYSMATAEGAARAFRAPEPVEPATQDG